MGVIVAKVRKLWAAIGMMLIAGEIGVHLMGMAAAQEQVQGDAVAISDPADLRTIFGGYTIIGFFQLPDGVQDTWTEYHCPNGQSRYIRGGDLFKGRWQLRDGHICYSYDRPNPGETYCFDVYGDQNGGYELILTDHEEDGFRVFITRRLLGDPFRIQKLDGGSCDGLTS